MQKEEKVIAVQVYKKLKHGIFIADTTNTEAKNAK